MYVEAVRDGRREHINDYKVFLVRTPSSLQVTCTNSWPEWLAYIIHCPGLDFYTRYIREDYQKNN